ncbi:hypothetical protein CsSME_00029562 [Camellia sinensis var. sinensis]
MTLAREENMSKRRVFILNSFDLSLMSGQGRQGILGLVLKMRDQTRPHSPLLNSQFRSQWLLHLTSPQVLSLRMISSIFISLNLDS